VGDFSFAIPEYIAKIYRLIRPGSLESLPFLSTIISYGKLSPQESISGAGSVGWPHLQGRGVAGVEREARQVQNRAKRAIHKL
jgi:hypothetical protein